MAEKVQKVSSPLGIASLCIGIAGCCIGAIPYLGLIAIPLGGIGLIFAIIGLLISIIGRKSTIGFQVAGGIICVIAMFFSYCMSYSAHMAVGRMLGLVDENWNVIEDYSSAKKAEDNSEGVSLTPTSENNSQSVTVAPSAMPNDGISTSGMTQNELFELAIKRNKENREREKEMERRGANKPSSAAPTPVVSTPPTVKSEPIANTTSDDGFVPEGKWYDASKEGIRLGSIEVKITKVEIGKLTVISTDFMGDKTEYQRDKDTLQVYLEVKNCSENKKTDAFSWSAHYARDDASLVDNFENEYDHEVPLERSVYKESFDYKTLYPGDAVNEVVAFEIPVKGVKYLYLTLNGSRVDKKEKGVYRFQIPASMIKRQ
ncbi:MAG: hypothetical protein IJG38_12015 [Thermoguttaceae bacterium]|nr:hypothetical protein [Thermoguttaceae bacterium]